MNTFSKGIEIEAIEDNNLHTRDSFSSILLDRWNGAQRKKADYVPRAKTRDINNNADIWPGALGFRIFNVEEIQEVLTLLEQIRESSVLRERLTELNILENMLFAEITKARIEYSICSDNDKRDASVKESAKKAKYNLKARFLHLLEGKGIFTRTEEEKEIIETFLTKNPSIRSDYIGAISKNHNGSFTMRVVLNGDQKESTLIVLPEGSYSKEYCAPFVSSGC